MSDFNRPTNPPAFPVQSVYIEDQETNSRGMSLRDYFAAAALPMAIKEMNDIESMDINDAAIVAYQYADAMLKAREQE